MKYGAEIDLPSVNVSHALLAELVGRERRVLDVGCAGGDLGRMLKHRGCRVAGVELDAAAAQLATQVLDEVLVGDVSDLDLAGHFGGESFDVIVFGDVLEYLANPVAVLMKVQPLLADSGSVVASIPNIAHGSMRLSLLQGRFDYRPRGLLDSTYIRFFTRGSVLEVFREAGLVPIDMRRTTVGVFDTEISIRRADFDEGVIDAVVGDPDSTTYQFVLRAVREDSPEALGPLPRPSTPPRPVERCQIGVWGSFDPGDIRHALVMRVTSAELARRIPGASIRSFSSMYDVRPSPHDGGMPIEALGAWSAERAKTLATELDCIVIAGDLPEPRAAELDGGRHPARFLLEALDRESDEECAVVWSAVRLPGEALKTLDGAAGSPAYRAVLDVSLPNQSINALDDRMVPVPDPLLLVPRLLQGEALARRLEFARIMGWYPQEGAAVVLEVDGGLLPHAEAVARALDAAVSGRVASVVLIQSRPNDADGDRAAAALSGAMAGPVYRVPIEALVDDLVAVIANAAALAVSSSSGTALGLAYERRMAYVNFTGDASLGQLAGVAGKLDAVVTQPGELAYLLDGERFHPAAGMVAKMQSKLGTHFDRIAAIADAAGAARPPAPFGGTVLPLSEYVAAVELAHRGMQERLDSERRVIADHLDTLRREHEALRAQSESLSALRTERDHAVADLKALQGIRVLRMLRPVREVYARLRGGRL